jgi:hypothetical protein
MISESSAPRLVPVAIGLWIGLAVAASPLACDPVDEAPPPATAQNAASATPPDSAPQTTPPASGEASGEGPETDPSAREYNVGEDTDSYGDDDPSALTDFRDSLSPYGEWVDDPTYGTVWAPSAAAVGPDFRPYVSAGHWTYDDDWVWASDYPWGWAPFHYGRWVLVEGRGWVWIPGRAYRGAWVTWGVDDGYGYLGWAPMPPLFVWFGGAPVFWRGPYVAPRWAYCPRHDVFAPSVATRVVTGSAVAPVAARMRVYVATTGRPGAGPAPARFGFEAAALPRPTGTAAAGVVRATQFARPSTAQPLGARPPTAVARPVSLPGAPALSRPSGGAPAPWHPSAGPAAAPLPRVSPAPRPAAPAPMRPAPRVAPAPVFRGGAHFGGGGGHHR